MPCRSSSLDLQLLFRKENSYAGHDILGNIIRPALASRQHVYRVGMNKINEFKFGNYAKIVLEKNQPLYSSILVYTAPQQCPTVPTAPPSSATDSSGSCLDASCLEHSQCSQIVKLFGPHHTTHELMLSFFIKSFVPLTLIKEESMSSWIVWWGPICHHQTFYLLNPPLPFLSIIPTHLCHEEAYGSNILIKQYSVLLVLLEKSLTMIFIIFFLN